MVISAGRRDLTHQVPKSVDGVHSPAVAPDSVWEIVFLMVILKIPIAYLCVVVYYAIKAEPKPEEGAPVTARIGPEDEGPRWVWRLNPRRFRPRPHGGPTRTYPRTPLPAHARADAEPGEPT
jgi:hypothetical protein